MISSWIRVSQPTLSFGFYDQVLSALDYSDKLDIVEKGTLLIKAVFSLSVQPVVRRSVPSIPSSLV